jgi:hypothetical protein
METTWDNMKGEIEDGSIFDKVEAMITAAEEAANRALLNSEEFLEAREAQEQVSGNAVDTVPSANHASARIDSTLRPKDALGRTMSVEEFNLWFTGLDTCLTPSMDACLDWDQKVLEHGNEENERQLLDNYLESDPASALLMIEQITPDTPIGRTTGFD